jgi:hypothetical protein
MALSPPSAIAAQIVADIKALTPGAGAPITDAILTQIWTKVVTRIYTDLQSNAQVAPGTFMSPPGVSGGPVSGDGGPIL